MESKGKLLLILLVALNMINFFTLADSSQPNFSDCMKNPFASGCRGISAKRSAPQQAGEPTFMDALMGEARAGNWLEAIKTRASQQRATLGRLQPVVEITQVFLAANDEPLRLQVRSAQPEVAPQAD